MQGAKQEVATKWQYNQLKPPSFEIRRLRAKLILEEALETIEALGIDLYIADRGAVCLTCDGEDIGMSNIEFDDNPSQWDHEGVIDGCADISVVTIGTLAALGVDDEPVLETVDLANLSKLAEGHSFREDGKLIKSPDFINPNYVAAQFIGKDISRSIKDFKVI